MIDRELDPSARSPERAILLQSPRREPWVKRQSTYIEPQRGGTFPTNAKTQTATTQNKCSHRKCRSYGALIFCIRVYPRVAFRALPSFHPGLCRSVVPTALTPAHPTNPTTNANNDTQPIQQQTQITTPPNQSNNKSKQRHRPTNPTINANNDTEQ